MVAVVAAVVAAPVVVWPVSRQLVSTRRIAIVVSVGLVARVVFVVLFVERLVPLLVVVAWPDAAPSKRIRL